MLRATAVVSKATNRQSLIQGNDYEVIGIRRFVSKNHRRNGRTGGFYPKTYFLDDELIPPTHWVLRKYGDDEYTYDPPELSTPGFYERLCGWD